MLMRTVAQVLELWNICISIETRYWHHVLNTLYSGLPSGWPHVDQIALVYNTFLTIIRNSEVTNIDCYLFQSDSDKV
jgi:hypothetical protein